MTARWQYLMSLSISVGMAFATSCFAMVAGIASAAGRWTTLAIGCSTLLMLSVAQSFGRLARQFPSAPGVRTYTKVAFGNVASLFFVFTYLLVIALIAGVESSVFAGIVLYVLPSLDSLWVVVALFALVLVTNLIGYEFSRIAQLIMVAIMLGAVLSLSIHALMNPDPAAGLRTVGPATQVAALPGAMISAFFLFVGFEWVANLQSGSRTAAAQLPHVLTGAVVLLGVIYVTFSAAVAAHLDAASLSATDKPQLLLASRLWGEHGAWTFLVVSTLAVLTSFNAGVLGASRLVYGLAREGFLPRVLTAAVSSNGVPIIAIVVTTLVSFAAAMLARRINDAYLLGSVAAVLICINYCGLLAASARLDRPAATTMHGAARIAGFTALAVMGGLVVLLLFQESSIRQAAISLAAIGLLLLLACFANRRMRAGWRLQS